MRNLPPTSTDRVQFYISVPGKFPLDLMKMCWSLVRIHYQWILLKPLRWNICDKFWSLWSVTPSLAWAAIWRFGWDKDNRGKAVTRHCYGNPPLHSTVIAVTSWWWWWWSKCRTNQSFHESGELLQQPTALVVIVLSAKTRDNMDSQLSGHGMIGGSGHIYNDCLAF